MSEYTSEIIDSSETHKVVVRKLFSTNPYFAGNMSNSKDKGTFEEQSSTTFDIKFMLETMNKKWNRRWEMMKERLNQGSSQKPHGAQQRETKTEENYFEGEFSDEEDRESGFLHQRPRGPRKREGRNRADDNVNNIKMKIPAFQGRSDPEAYLEWEKNI